MAETPIRFQGSIRESDYVYSQYLHLRPRPAFAAVGTLILLLFGIALVSSPSWVGLAVLAYLALWILVFIPWHAKKRFRQYKALSVPVSGEARDNGIFFKNENAEGLIPWLHVVKWRQSRASVLLYPVSDLFMLLPAHWFSTPEGFSAFKELLSKHVGNAT